MRTIRALVATSGWRASFAPAGPQSTQGSSVSLARGVSAAIDLPTRTPLPRAHRPCVSHVNRQHLAVLVGTDLKATTMPWCFGIVYPSLRARRRIPPDFVPLEMLADLFVWHQSRRILAADRVRSSARSWAGWRGVASTSCSCVFNPRRRPRRGSRRVCVAYRTYNW
jgi:hypothetical protein